MKKKYVLFITIVTLFSTLISTFAQNVKIDNYKASEDVVLRNNRYYYTYEYESMLGGNLHVSESDARTEKIFRQWITNNLVDIVVSYYSNSFLGKLAWSISDNFYRSPYAAVGDYYITQYEVKKIQNDRLTGEKKTVDIGYKFIIEHNGESIERTFWIK